MGKVAKFKRGELLISGITNERTPSIRNGLKRWFPFDGTYVGQQKKNLMDTSQWVVGRYGSQGSFVLNGNASADINTVMMYPGPFGYEEPVWAALSNDASSDDDGGWNHSDLPIDPTKKYRFSVWVRRENMGNGTFFMGCKGATVQNLFGVADNNPYFAIMGPDSRMNNEWVLVVSYVYPYTYSSTDNGDAGYYTVNGQRIEGATGFKWISTATVTTLRTYLYYSTSTKERMFWCRPRVELCDGTESTIQDLLLGMDDNCYIKSEAYTTMTNRGVAIEQPLTNVIISDPDGQPWGRDTSDVTITRSQERPAKVGEYVVKWSKASKSSSGNAYINSTTNITRSITGTAFTFSCYVRRADDKPVTSVGWVYFYLNRVSDGVRLTDNVNPTHILDCGDGWYRVIRTAVVASECYVELAGFSSLVGTTDWYFDGWQIEAKKVATSVSPYRAYTGSLEIPLNLGSNFTIAYKFTPDVRWSSVEPAYGYDIFSLRDKNTGKSITHSDYTNSAPWLGFDSFFASGENSMWHWHTIANWQPGKEYWFVLAKNGTGWYKYFSDETGIVSSTGGSSKAEVLAFSPDLLTMNGGFCAVYRDFLFYDRALSLDEIKAIMGTPFIPDNKGNMYNEISEMIDTPDDVLYFPLSSDTLDIYKNIQPSEQVNLVHDDSAVWVGIGNINQAPDMTRNGIHPDYAVPGSFKPGWDNNLHYNAITMTGWSGGYNGGVPSPTIGYHAQWVYEGIGDKDPCIKFVDDNTQFGQRYRWMGVSGYLGTPNDLGWTVGSVITISWYQKVTHLMKAPRLGIYHRSKSAGAMGFTESIAAYYSTTTGVWERKSYSFTITSDWDLTIACSIYIYGEGNSIEATSWIDRVQIERRPYMTPDISSGGASLEFNLYRDYGLNWNQDWSIVYWKKPMGTHADNLTGYNIESIGCNSNSVGGGYAWWGKAMDANYVSNTTGVSDFTPSDYFSKWHMVSLVHQGSVLSIRYWGIPGVTASWNTSVPQTVAANYYVTQYGYDLKLGGWDNVYACGTYFKDLIVAKRAFSESELSKLFNNKYHIEKGIMNINGLLREGKTL